MHLAFKYPTIVSADESSDRQASISPRAVVTAAGEFFWRNRRYVLRDLLAALAWVVILTAVFVFASLPGWLYYVLLFGGLLVYSLVMSVLGVAARLDR